MGWLTREIRGKRERRELQQEVKVEEEDEQEGPMITVAHSGFLTVSVF